MDLTVHVSNKLHHTTRMMRQVNFCRKDGNIISSNTVVVGNPVMYNVYNRVSNKDVQ